MKLSLRNLVTVYLTFLAKGVVKKFQPRFIVITGTAGKTTAKNTIYAVLKVKFGARVAQSYGSMGTIIGLPLALLQIQPSWVDQNQTSPPVWQWPGWLSIAGIKYALFFLKVKPYPKLWVIEFTADHPGDFDRLLNYIRPSVSVVTNVGPGHLEYFGDEDGVAREKSRIVTALPTNGRAILNWFDLKVKAMAKQTKAQIVWVKADNLDFASAAAHAVGQVFGMSNEQIQRGLKKTVPLPHRFDLIAGLNQSVLIDSTYNANPVSTIAVLKTVRQLAMKNHRSRIIAVLGDMLELGPRSIELHRQVGREARSYVDLLVTIGSMARCMNGDYHAQDISQAERFLKQTLKKGDTIVIKASHGMRLDRLVEKFKSIS